MLQVSGHQDYRACVGNLEKAGILRVGQIVESADTLHRITVPVEIIEYPVPLVRWNIFLEIRSAEDIPVFSQNPIVHHKPNVTDPESIDDPAGRVLGNEQSGNKEVGIEHDPLRFPRLDRISFSISRWVGRFALARLRALLTASENNALRTAVTTDSRFSGDTSTMRAPGLPSFVRTTSLDFAKRSHNFRDCFNSPTAR